MHLRIYIYIHDRPLGSSVYYIYIYSRAASRESCAEQRVKGLLEHNAAPNDR